MAGDDSTAAALTRISEVARMLADPRPLAAAGAKAAKEAAVTVGAQLGPLRHMGKGVRLNAGYDLEAGGGRIVLRLRPAGAWVITESGAKIHDIRPKARRRRAVRQGGGRPPAVTLGGVPRAVAHGAHAAGRRGISRAFGRARGVIPTAIHDAQVQAMRRIYG